MELVYRLLLIAGIFKTALGALLAAVGVVIAATSLLLAVLR